MMCWICNFKANDEVSSDSLLSKLGLQDIYVVLRYSKKRWYGHVERVEGFISQVRNLNVVAPNISGKLRKSWDEVLFGLNIFISKFCTETIQKHAINDRIRTKA